jgi:hypothetical protein
MADIIYKDTGLKAIIKKVGQLASGPHVKVGVIGGGRNADIAVIHEYGAPAAGIPERSFIRSTFANGQVIEAQKKLVASLMGKITTNKMEVGQALGLLGAFGADRIKRTIDEGEGVPPPLKPATIARKGSSRPLVDTGQMRNSITWEVVGAYGGQDGPKK